MGNGQLRCPKCGCRINTTSREEVQGQFKQAFQPWRLEEDEKLRDLVEAGNTDVLVLARAFQRQPSAVLRRIEKFGFKPKVGAAPAAQQAVQPPEDVRPL